MRNFYNLLVVTTLLFSNQLIAQSPPDIEELKKQYENFFELDRENIFLHINKTSVIPEEDLWLKAYIYNSKMEVSNVETANLEVGIYRKNGEHLDTKTLYIQNGKGAGYLDLDAEKYPPGDYFLKASTNYMKNFSEDLSFVQNFKVMGKEGPVQEKQISYDLQLLPEGGYLLSESLNTVGVKLIDNSGAGAPFISGRVLDSKGREITKFQSNRHGLSKFTFIPVPNEEYEVVVENEIGGKNKIRKSLPTAKEKGITILSALRNDEHLLSVRTNDATRRQLGNKKFFLVIHKDGNIKDLEFEFPEDQVEFHIRMKKDSLFPGVNTVTVFDENSNPLAERLIFSRNNIKRSSIQAVNQGLLRDSVKVGLQAQPSAAAASLSISVLPSETKAYDPNHNIISAFHLKPYIQGYIDEPAYYFSSGNEQRKEYDLDLLLLSQGWSKYEWQNIFDNPPKEIHERVVGYKLEGQLTNRNEKRHKNIMIRSEDSGIFEITDIEADDIFKEDRLFIVEDAELSFSLVNDKNSKVSAPSLHVAVLPEKEINNLNREFYFPERKKFNEIPAIPEAFSRTEYELDTVEISTKKFVKHVYDPEMQIHAKGYIITEEISQQFNHIADYIATKGFLVTHVNGWVEVRSTYVATIAGGGPSGGPMSVARGAKTNVMFYLNGAPIGFDASFITGLPTAQVESIIINKHGFGYGVNGVHGVIEIYTKQGGMEVNNRKTVKTVIAGNGYTLHKKFYVPLYKVVNTSAFDNYGVVDWKPSVVLNEEGKAEVLISKTGPVSLFIEGMNAQGVLLSEILTIE